MTQGTMQMMSSSPGKAYKRNDNSGSTVGLCSETAPAEFR